MPYANKAQKKFRDRLYRRRNRNPEKHRLERIKHKYGLTAQQWWAMFEAQEGLCGICKGDFGHKLHVDHNHQTEKIRGLLCVNCNTMLGHAKDDPDRLAAGIHYLKANV